MTIINWYLWMPERRFLPIERHGYRSRGRLKFVRSLISQVVVCELRVREVTVHHEILCILYIVLVASGPQLRLVAGAGVASSIGTLVVRVIASLEVRVTLLGVRAASLGVRPASLAPVVTSIYLVLGRVEILQLAAGAGHVPRVNVLRV